VTQLAALAALAARERNNMKIPLSQGKFAIVGPRDYKYLMQWKWYYKNGYAVRNGPRPKRGSIQMHRVVLERMGFKNFEACDHANRSSIDNRRANLRPATHQQNMHNRSKPRHNTSGHLGVSWHKRDKKWEVRLQISGSYASLGYFDSVEEAVRVRDNAAKKHYGEFAVLNKD
jgi:hypothetical protein